MRLSIISFTMNGIQLEKSLAYWLDEECDLYTKCCAYCNCNNKEKSVYYVSESIAEWAKLQLEQRNALIFIGACGIAVRAIAPYITDKLHDSPVIVIDEKGRYVIPILSGHMGGANELANIIADKINATAIITTATDINGKFSVDMFAKKNKLSIVDKEGIAKISSKVLLGETITMSIESGHFIDNSSTIDDIQFINYPPKGSVDVIITSEKREYDATLLLIPQEYVIGMGCKKGKKVSEIESFINATLEKVGISINQILGLATIDMKKDEQGLIEWCKRENKSFLTYSAEELNSLNGDFSSSTFVKDTVGVDNVCERAALMAAGNGGELFVLDGMTIAIAKREWSVG